MNKTVKSLIEKQIEVIDTEIKSWQAIRDQAKTRMEMAEANINELQKQNYDFQTHLIQSSKE